MSTYTLIPSIQQLSIPNVDVLFPLTTNRCMFCWIQKETINKFKWCIISVHLSGTVKVKTEKKTAQT